MRTKTLLLTAAVCAAGIATSQAQAVYSVNAVGYVNTSLVKGLNLISNPLDNKTSNKIKDLFAALPPGGQVFKFNSATSKYQIAAVDEFDGTIGGEAAELVLAPGEGVFVSVSAAATLTFVGEVPAGNLSNPLPKGFSIRASQVPQAGKLATDLKYAPEEGDQVFIFNDTTQKYEPHGFEFGEWSGGEPTIDVGEAFFLSTQTARNWTRSFSIGN